MNINFSEYKKTATKFFSYLFFIIAIVISIVIGFFIGENFHKFSTNKTIKNQIVYVKKGEVNIAIDEANRLILMNNKSGECVIYSDSVGSSIFSMYAKQIWNKPQ